MDIQDTIKSQLLPRTKKRQLSPVHLKRLHTDECPSDYATLQCCMLNLFSDMVERFLEIFMDDFSIYGDSFDQCLHHLKLVLQRCIENNLTLNWKKWHFMIKHGFILGHEISSRGIEVDKSKVEVIAKLPKPKCLKDIRSFLRHAGFYRRFIKEFSKIARPLTNLLGKHVPFHFDDECLKV